MKEKEIKRPHKSFKSSFIWRLTKLSRAFNNFQIDIVKKLRIPKAIGYPKELFVEPTNYCNAKCPLCPTGAGLLKRKKGFITSELFKKIIDEVKLYTTTILLWNQGEPFLNRNVFAMIKYAKKANLFVISSTNGTCLQSKIGVEKLMDSGLDYLLVGIDGVDEATYSKYRKGLNFFKLIKGLKYLKLLKKRRKTELPVVGFQFIVMKHNQHQIKDISQLAKQLGTELRLKYLNIKMVEVAKEDQWLPTKNSLKFPKIRNESPIAQGKYCPAWDGMVINWDGTVNPCCYDYYGNIRLGNVAKSSIGAIWRSSKFTEFRKKIIKNRDEVKICSICPIESAHLEAFNVPLQFTAK